MVTDVLIYKVVVEGEQLCGQFMLPISKTVMHPISISQTILMTLYHLITFNCQHYIVVSW